jgi:hypothetical protein
MTLLSSPLLVHFMQNGFMMRLTSLHWILLFALAALVRSISLQTQNSGQHALLYQKLLDGRLAGESVSSNSTFCHQDVKNGAVHLHLQVQNDTEAGRPLTLYLDIVFDRALPNSSSSYAHGILWSLYYGLDELFTYQKTTLGVNESLIINKWGPFFRGPTLAEYHVSPDSVKGTVDGRNFSVSLGGPGRGKMRFEDGLDPPKVIPPPGLPRLLTGFDDLVSRALKKECAASNVSQAPIPNQLQYVRFLDRIQDPGHSSLPSDEPVCVICRTGVLVAEAAADVGCAWAGAFTFGVGFVACVAGTAAAAFSGLEACYHSGACCPHLCGPEEIFLSTCCLGQETCLSAATGLCCYENQVPCVNKACCHRPVLHLRGTSKGDLLP